jgi:hypothetical protein
MHLRTLKRIALCLAALAIIAAFSAAVYFVPALAVLAFLALVALAFVLRFIRGDRKKAWRELLKSLLLDW